MLISSVDLWARDSDLGLAYTEMKAGDGDKVSPSSGLMYNNNNNNNNNIFYSSLRETKAVVRSHNEERNYLDHSKSLSTRTYTLLNIRPLSLNLQTQKFLECVHASTVTTSYYTLAQCQTLTTRKYSVIVVTTYTYSVIVVTTYTYSVIVVTTYK